MEKEEWRLIRRHPRYEVSSWGRVRVKETERMVCFSISKNRHNVHLVDEGGSRTYHVGKLVAEAFVGACPEGRECSHLDDNSLNDRADNLAWETKKENDARRSGVGFRNFRKSTIGEMKWLLSMGVKSCQIAIHYGVRQSYFSQMKKKEYWQKCELVPCPEELPKAMGIKKREWASATCDDRQWKGLCRRCGKKREHYKAYCDECSRKHREYMRKKRACGEWRPGKRGRPPTIPQNS
jgi:hypothetical protein